MITGATLTPARARYLADQVATSREDYYSGEGESEGRWFGAAAEALGLRGPVKDGQLEPLLDGVSPLTGERLRSVIATRTITIPIPHPDTGEPSSVTRELKPVGGFDFVLSAPKSISAAHALAEPKTAREILAAHHSAVDAALTLLEQEAAYVRTGRHGLVREPARGIAAALYTHRLSRDLDPQLHTHCAIANLAQGNEEKWRTLDSQTLLRRWKLTLGYAYRAHLRHEINERLGWQFTAPVRGLSELAAWEPDALRSLSTRRQHIEAHLANLGSDTWMAGQVAALATRAVKPKDFDLAELRDEWRERINTEGMSDADLETALEPRAPARPTLDSEALFESLTGPDGLTERQTTFSRADGMRAIAEAAHQGLAIEELRHLSDQLLERPEVIGLPDELYTMQDLVSHEQALLRLATEGRDAGVAAISDEQVQRSLAMDDHLTEEQRSVVRRIATSGHAIENIEALAGAGKTTTAGAIADAYRTAGYRVIGAAPTARAARELAHAGIPASTISRILHEAEVHLSGPDPLVAVIDEAGMAGTRDLAQLTTLLRSHGAKIVQIGDARQLSGVPAGGGFAALSERHGAERLDVALRQRDTSEREALQAIRAMDPSAYLARKLQAKELEITADPDRVPERVAEWWTGNASEHGAENVLVITRRGNTAAALNQHVRAARIAAGELGTEAVCASGREYAVGDRVMTRRNDVQLDLDNGTRGTVSSVDRSHRSLIVRSDDGRDLAIPADYLDSGHMQHAYVQTAHLAQGSTAETTLVVTTPDEHAAEWSYTAASRSRGVTHHLVLAVADDRQREPGDSITLDPSLAVAHLAESMRHEQSDRLAVWSR